MGSTMRNKLGRNPQGLSRNQLIGSVANTLQLLEIFSEGHKELPLSAIARWSRKPKASVHRMLATLVNLGFLEQDAESGHYRQTLKLWRLGVSALEGLDLITCSRPHLEALMQSTDETVHLATLDPSTSNVIYVSKFESARSIRVQTTIGRLVPSWCTATGRSILAFNPKIAEEVLSRPLVAQTSFTVTDPAKIRRILANAQRDGYVASFKELHIEMGGVAAPIRDHSGAVIAACGVAVPAFRLNEDLVEKLIPEVKKIAKAISTDLGYRA